MSDKEHQSSTVGYQIRIDGEPVYFPHSIDIYALNKYSELCANNPDCYVDIVRVNTEIIVSQCEYHQFKRHFEK